MRHHFVIHFMQSHGETKQTKKKNNEEMTEKTREEHLNTFSWHKLNLFLLHFHSNFGQQKKIFFFFAHTIFKTMSD